MSDDLLRIARQMLAELEASEAYLRSIAIEALPYPKVMAVERRAGRRCAELLAGLGGTTFEFAAVDDATDELLIGVVRPTNAVRGAGDRAGRNDSDRSRGAGVDPALQNRGSLAAASSVGAYEPFDDGPEGAADDGNDLHSEEEPPRVQSADADTAELASRAPPPMSSPGFVTFDDAFAGLSRASESDDEPTISAKRSSDDLFDNLVTFDDPVSTTPTAVMRAVAPPPPKASGRSVDPGRGSSLVTIDETPGDRLANALSGDGPETFDLIPDLAEDDLAGFEDEEVTVVKPSDSSSWDTNKSNKLPAPRSEPKSVPPPPPRKDTVDWAALAKPAQPPPAQPAPAQQSSGQQSSGQQAPASASRVQAPLPAARTPATAAPRPANELSKPPVNVPAPKSATPAPAAAGRLPTTRAPEPSRNPSSTAPASDRTSDLARPKTPPPGKAPAPVSRSGAPGSSPSGASQPLSGSQAQSGSQPQAASQPLSTSQPSGSQPSATPTRASVPTAAPGKPQPARAAVTAAPPSTKPQPGMLPGKAAKGTPGPAAAAASAAASSRVTAGLYGGGSVPTIRDSDEPRPRAAAIQLNASGSGARVLGMEEEEEPIEIGEAEDDDDDMDMDGGGGGGFSVKLQRYEDADDDDDDELELAEEDLEVIQPAQVIPLGPTPDEVRSMLQRAVAAAAAGDLQGGADLYSDVIDADPDNVMAHVARGRLFLDLGDYSRAMSDFMVGEDIAPNDPEPQVAIGDLYFARKDYRKAIDYFNAALEVSPNHAMAYCRRGISHYYRKNYKEAVDDLLKAERLDREIPNIQTYVSMARKKVKR